MRRMLSRGEGVAVTHWVIKREANANQQRGADVSRKWKLRRMRQRGEEVIQGLGRGR